MPTRKKNRGEETALSQAIQQALTANGARVIRVQSGMIQATTGDRKYFIHCAPKGTPDLIAIRPGTPAQVTFIEVKRKTGKLTEAQEQWQLWAKLNGVRAFVVRGIQEALDAVFKEQTQ